jgi:hypothetical protein
MDTLRGCGEVLLVMVIIFGLFVFVLPIGGLIVAFAMFTIIGIFIVLEVLDHIKK